MKVRVIATIVMALCFAVGSASASSIGVFFAPDASDCDMVQPGGGQGTFYIVAILGGDAGANGMTTAELRVDGFPTGWFPNVQPNPAANVNLGSVLGGGANLGFPACQQGGGRVLLYTVAYFATSQVPETYLTVNQHTNPSSPFFLCPLITQCDANFTKLCVPGGQAIMNGVPCTVGVEPATWTKVKDLYKN